MQTLSLIGTVAFIHLLAVMSPGPDFIMTVRNSLTYSRKTGIWTAVGLGLGITVHMVYCMAGLAFIIAQSIVAFNAIKFLGAGYLMFIGIQSIRARSSKIEIHEVAQKPDIAPWAAIKIGFFTNVLNPKATLYFLSLFTFVLSPETPGSLMAVLSVIMVAEMIAWFSLVAMFFTARPVRGIFEKFQGVFHKTLGGILVLLGVKVALSEK